MPLVVSVCHNLHLLFVKFLFYANSLMCLFAEEITESKHCPSVALVDV